jgi:hypothetical protein
MPVLRITAIEDKVGGNVVAIPGSLLNHKSIRGFR